MGWGGIISGALSIGGALLSAHSQNKAAKQQKEAAKESGAATYEAALAQKQELYQQAADLDEMARRQRVAADMRSYQIERAGKETASTAIQNYAASGVKVGAGSAGIVPAHIIGTAAEDVYTNIMNANDQIYQIQSQAAANRRQGDIKERAGLLAKNEGTSAAINAANSAITASYASSMLSIGNTISNQGWFK